MLKLSSCLKRINTKVSIRFFSGIAEVEQELKDKINNEIIEETE